MPFAVSISIGDTINSYSWDFGNGNNSTSQNPFYTYLSAGTYTVSLTETNNHGCSNTATTIVIVYPAPNVSAGPDQSVAREGRFFTSTNGNYSYQWTPANLNSQNIIVNPNATSNYIVHVTDANGCTNSDTVLVTVHPLPNVNAGPDQSSCSGSTFLLSSTGASSYTWFPGNINAASIRSPPLPILLIGLLEQMLSVASQLTR